MTDPQLAIIQSEYQDIVQALQALTERHEKTYRLEVGALILRRCFAGSAALFSSKDPTKQASFAAFLQTHAGELAELDHSEQTLRRCVRVYLCHQGLPPAVRDRLQWSATLALSAVADPNLRARIAQAAVSEQWPVRRMREVVEQAQQNRVWDSDPGAPGLQLPEPRGPTPPQPGRLVHRTEKWTEEVSAWREEFALIDATKLSPAHRERIAAALATLRGQLDEVEKKLRV